MVPLVTSSFPTAVYQPRKAAFFRVGGGQVVGAVLADQFRAGGDAAAVGVVGDGEVVFLYRKG